MIVVFPPSIRHDEGIVPSYYEDHLLERVSLLELQLAQAMEKIGMISSFFAREAKEIKKEQKFIRAFSELLKRENPLLAQELNRLSGEKIVEAAGKTETSGSEQQIQGRIFAAHNKPNSELFSHLLKEGIRLLKNGEEKQSFQMLERAALLSPENVPLLVFTAENFYRADKFEESKSYLERAFDSEPDNEKVLLLLGAIYADAGDIGNGRKFLSVLVNNEKTFGLVHAVWGVMAAFEENWSEAIAAFKLASGDKEMPELNYLIGCAYFQLGNYASALDFLQKIESAGVKYSDSHFMKSVIYKIENDSEAEKKELQIISETKEPGAQCVDYLSGKKQFDLTTALPFRHFRQSKKQLLTGGAPRLNKFFRERIFKVIE